MPSYRNEIIVLMRVFDMFQEQLRLLLGQSMAFIDQEHAFSISLNETPKP